MPNWFTLRLRRGVSALLVALVVILAPALSAQTTPENLSITSSSGTFTLPSVSSLMNETAVLGAERVAELALPAIKNDTSAAARDLDAIDADIDRNREAIEKETEALAKEQARLQPTIDAYNSDDAGLKADDRQWRAEFAPLQAQIDAYNALPQKDRTEAEYNRLATLRAPFDARRAVLATRLAALQKRYEAFNATWTEAQRPLVALQDRDAELQGRWKEKAAELDRTYGQLQACYDYSTELKARLARINRAPSSTLTTALKAADQVLKALSSRGLGGAK